MKTVKSISKEANLLREKFQQTTVAEYIKVNGNLRGYKGQLYILLPKFDQRNALYKGVSKATYIELYNYLFFDQSQRRFSKYSFYNGIDIVKSFIAKDINICFSRVWHNGVSVYSGKHWAAQAAALLKGVEKYGFTYYEHDYNFGSHLFSELRNADTLLVSIYTRILDRKMANIVVSHEN